MIYVFAIGIVVVLAFFGLARLASGDRYGSMTEKEFEAEAKRSSTLGAMTMEVRFANLAR